MIIADFLTDKDGELTGFRISGHSGYADEGGDIVCSAVSAMAYMTANTITEVLCLSPEIKTDDGLMSLFLKNGDEKKCGVILKGFYLQMSELQKEYPKFLRVKRGVENA